MAWIEYHDALWDFWKVNRLAKAIDIPYAHALGLISCLWTWAVRNQPCGILKRFTDDEIADAMRWTGKRPIPAKRFLINSELLDKKTEELHDWNKHGLRLLNQARERKKRWHSRLERSENVPVSKKEGRIDSKKGLKDKSAREGNAAPAAARPEVQAIVKLLTETQPFTNIKQPAQFASKIATAYGALACMTGLQRMTAWLAANPISEDKRQMDWARFVVKWLDKDKQGAEGKKRVRSLVDAIGRG